MNLQALVAQIVGFINLVIPVLGGIVLFLFLISVVRYIYKAGEVQSKSAERQAIGWGLLALFVLFSIWGILNIFARVLPYTSQPVPGQASPSTQLY